MLSSVKLKFWFILIVLLLSVNCSSTLKGMKSEEYDLLHDSAFKAYEHFIKGDFYSHIGEIDSAVEQYRLALSLEPDIDEIKLALARALFKLGKWEEALDQGLKIDPKDEEVWNFLGNCYSVLARIDDAIFSYENAVKVDSTNIDALRNLTFLYQKNGEMDKAITTWKMISDIHSFDAGIKIRLATMLMQNQRYDEAIQEYNKLIKLDPKNLQAWTGLGTAYLAKKEFDKIRNNLNNNGGNKY